MEIDDEEAEIDSKDPMLNLFPSLLRKLEFISSRPVESEESHLVEILSAVCLQILLGSFMPRRVLETFEKILQATNPWTRYRVARSASRYQLLMLLY